MLQQPQKPLSEDPLKITAIVVIIMAFIYIIWSATCIIKDSASKECKGVERVFIGKVLAVGDIDGCP
jgi:hypothetical protein